MKNLVCTLPAARGLAFVVAVVLISLTVGVAPSTASARSPYAPKCNLYDANSVGNQAENWMRFQSDLQHDLNRGLLSEKKLRKAIRGQAKWAVQIIERFESLARLSPAAPIFSKETNLALIERARLFLTASKHGKVFGASLKPDALKLNQDLRSSIIQVYYVAPTKLCR